MISSTNCGMVDAFVVNASPLIFLAAAGRLDLLRRRAAVVQVPRAVASEVARYGPDDPAARALREHAWLRVVEAAATPSSVLAWDLGPGESAVIAWALAQPGTIAVLDDLEGRSCARAHGLRVKGTLGLVIEAKRTGEIPSARAVMLQLRASGMYLSDRVLDRALAEVGE